MSAEPLSFVDAGGERLEVVVRVERGDGVWTPGPHVSIDSGNQLELTLTELEWLVNEAGPLAILELLSFQAGARPDTGEPSRPSSPPDGASRSDRDAPVAGQGASTRPEPAHPSPDAEES